MADSYLTISVIAGDQYMMRRVTACAAQQGLGQQAQMWAVQNAYGWAASPTWAEKWDYAVETQPDPDPDDEQVDYEPGADPAVITDADILATVQGLLNANPGPG